MSQEQGRARRIHRSHRAAVNPNRHAKQACIGSRDSSPEPAIALRFEHGARRRTRVPSLRSAAAPPLTPPPRRAVRRAFSDGRATAVRGGTSAYHRSIGGGDRFDLYPDSERRNAQIGGLVPRLACQKPRISSRLGASTRR
jgi:hypothetical protein